MKGLESAVVARKKRVAELLKSKAEPMKRVKKERIQKPNKIKDDDTPKRPTGAFLIFMEEFCKREFPDVKSGPAVGKAGGRKWKSVSATEKALFVEKASKWKAEYDNSVQEYEKKKPRQLPPSMTLSALSLAAVDDSCLSLAAFDTAIHSLSLSYEGTTTIALIDDQEVAHLVTDGRGTLPKYPPFIHIDHLKKWRTIGDIAFTSSGDSDIAEAMLIKVQKLVELAFLDQSDPERVHLFAVMVLVFIKEYNQINSIECTNQFLIVGYHAEPIVYTMRYGRIEVGTHMGYRSAIGSGARHALNDIDFVRNQEAQPDTQTLTELGLIAAALSDKFTGGHVYAVNVSRAGFASVEPPIPVLGMMFAYFSYLTGALCKCMLVHCKELKYTYNNQLKNVADCEAAWVTNNLSNVLEVLDDLPMRFLDPSDKEVLGELADQIMQV